MLLSTRHHTTSVSAQDGCPLHAATEGYQTTERGLIGAAMFEIKAVITLESMDQISLVQSATTENTKYFVGKISASDAVVVDPNQRNLKVLDEIRLTVR